MQKRVAVFDIDGTVFRSSLLVELVYGLIKEGVFPPEITRKFEEYQRSWLDRRGSYNDFVQAVVEAYVEQIRGVSFERYVSVVRSVSAHYQSRVYRYTRDLARELREREYYLLAISHSPREIVQAFCERQGFDKGYGSVFEVGQDGFFTGHVPDWTFLKKKANILTRALEKERLTLEGSYGIGDTESDIDMLEMVAHPICFNPSRKLYECAKDKKWKIVVERKDMIYEL